VLLHLPKETVDSHSDYETDSMLRLLLAELPLKRAVNLVVEISGQKKNKIYKQALEISKNYNGYV